MKKNFVLNGRDFSVDAGENVNVEMTFLENKDGVSYYKVAMEWDSLCAPDMVKLTYSFPSVDTYLLWDALEKKRSIPFSDGHPTDSRLASGMPLKGVISGESKNTHLIALSDVKSPIATSIGASIWSGQLDVTIKFFTALTGPFKTYETVLRIDDRTVDFDDAVNDAVQWYDELGYKNPYIPDTSKLPMYSTWYSYGQKVTEEDVIRECEMAASMGMKAVIIDDGWQTDGSGAAYAYCGDWKPLLSKFPDMKAMCDKIHALGMQVMLWYSVPFVGSLSENYKRFEGKYLCYLENVDCAVLDPRYKEVRDFLVGTYVTAVKEWGLDGLKLDFIDRFKTNGEYNEEMDHLSVEEATVALLSEINTELRKINPDILLEFRQPYFGPVINAYGNMMRVWDCPLDGSTNKTQSINLRLVSGNVAVHSDMIYWHKNDNPENVARHLWGTMFSVPQISARLDNMTDEQEAVLRNYLDFWTQKRKALVSTRVKVSFVENGYGSAQATVDGERIIMLSASPLLEILDDDARVIAINLCGVRTLTLVNRSASRYTYKVIDHMGGLLETGESDRTYLELKTPYGGRIEIEK